MCHFSTMLWCFDWPLGACFNCAKSYPPNMVLVLAKEVLQSINTKLDSTNIKKISIYYKLLQHASSSKFLLQLTVYWQMFTILLALFWLNNIHFNLNVLILLVLSPNFVLRSSLQCATFCTAVKRSHAIKIFTRIPRGFP